MPEPALQSVRGANYIPYKDWNAYQMWADYKNHIIERELDMAQALGFNSLRVWGSYEHWRENGPKYFAHHHHFIDECDKRGIMPLIVLFEAPPDDPPTPENRTDRNPDTAFGVHSPSRPAVLQPRNWDGYPRSPLHFTRRFAQEFGNDPRLLAVEIMNEPANNQPRQDFVVDMANEVRDHASQAVLTMGCKDFHFNAIFNLRIRGGLDVHQFHMNLPVDGNRAREIIAEAEQYRDRTGKPLWCTEWQRTRVEPPSRFMPNAKSLAPIVYEAVDRGAYDGNYLWGLMLKPAYLKHPRELGRYNGLMHENGAAFDLGDCRSVARSEGFQAPERHDIPEGWQDHRFPYPRPSQPPPKGGGGMSRGERAARLGGIAAALKLVGDVLG